MLSLAIPKIRVCITCPKAVIGWVTLVFSQHSIQSNAILPSSRNLHGVFLILAVVDCGNLSDPANGQVNTSGTTFGQTVTYSCNTGYSLAGNSTRTCQATGNWSGSAPTCQGLLLKVISFHHYMPYLGATYSQNV